jgi:hypothetical protein
MQNNPFAKKMKLKPGMRAAVINAPPGYLQKLSPLPEGTSLSDKLEGQLDWIQVFTRNQAELKTTLPGALKALSPQGLLWISFPKGSSKIQSDLTRDQGWEPVQEAELKWINLVSVDETWSAFSLRPYRPGEARQSFR